MQTWAEVGRRPRATTELAALIAKSGSRKVLQELLGFPAGRLLTSMGAATRGDASSFTSRSVTNRSRYPMAGRHIRHQSRFNPGREAAGPSAERFNRLTSARNAAKQSASDP